MAEAIQLSPGGALLPPPNWGTLLEGPTQTLEEAAAEAQQQPSPTAPQAVPLTPPPYDDPQSVDWVARLRARQEQVLQRNQPIDYGQLTDAPPESTGPPPPPPSGGFGTAAYQSFLNSLGSMATGAAQFLRQPGSPPTAEEQAAQQLIQNVPTLSSQQKAAGVAAVEQHPAAQAAADWFLGGAQQFHQAADAEGKQLDPGYKAGGGASAFGTDIFGGAVDPATGKIPTPGEVGWGNYLAATGAGLAGWLGASMLPAGVFGRVMSGLGVMTRTAGTTTALFGTGGTAGAGQVYERLTEEVNKTPDAELQKKNPQYRELRVGGASEAAAKKAAVDKEYPLLSSFIINGLANVALGQAIPGVARGSFIRPTSRSGAAWLGAGEGAAGMGGGIAGTEAALQWGQQGLGLRDEFDLDRILYGGALGAAGGAALGGGIGGAIGAGRQARVTPTPVVDPAAAAALAAAGPNPTFPSTPQRAPAGPSPVWPDQSVPPQPPPPANPTWPVTPQRPPPGPSPVWPDQPIPPEPGPGPSPVWPTTPQRPPPGPSPVWPGQRPLPPEPGPVSPVWPTTPQRTPAGPNPTFPEYPVQSVPPAEPGPVNPTWPGTPQRPPPGADPTFPSPASPPVGPSPVDPTWPATPQRPPPGPSPVWPEAIQTRSSEAPPAVAEAAPREPSPVWPAAEAIPTRAEAPVGAAAPSPFESMSRDQLLNVATRAGVPAETLRPLDDAQIRTMLDEALARGQEQRAAAEGAAAPLTETTVAVRGEAAPAGETAVAARTETQTAAAPAPAPSRATLETRLGELGLSKSEIRKLGAKPKLEAEVQRLEAAAKPAEELPTVGREEPATETPIAALRTTEEAPAKPGLVKIAEARARQTEKAAAARAIRETAARERAEAEAATRAERQAQEQAETQAQTKATEARRSREIAEEGPAGQRKVPERGTTQAERDAAREGPREDSVVDDAWLDRERTREDDEIPTRTEEGTQPLAPSTTDTLKIARNIEKRYREGQFADDPAEAADAFPTRPDTPEERAKGGQPRTGPKSLIEHLDREIARLEDPATEQALIEKAAELQNTRPANRDEGNAKARRSASLNLEMRRLDPDHIQSLKTMREEVSQALKSREGKTLDAPPAAARQERSGPWGTRRGVTSEQLSQPVRDAFDGRTSTSMHSLLSAFSNNSYVRSHAPQLAAFARWLQNALPQTLQVHRADNLSAPAQYRYGGRTEDQVLMRGDATFEDLLHDASHGVTARFVDQLQPGSREARVLKLFEEELTRLRDNGLDDAALNHALLNWSELHTMLGTSSDLYRLLSQHAGSPQFRAGLAALGYADKSRSLWQSFVKFVRRGLGMPQSFTNIMDHALRPVQDIYQQAHEYNLANLDRSVWTMSDPQALQKIAAAFESETARGAAEGQRALNAPNPTDYVRQVWDDRAYHTSGAWNWMRPILNQLKTDYGLEQTYERYFTKDGRNLLQVERMARNATQRLQMDELKRVEPIVKDLVQRMRVNQPTANLLVDATRAEAHLGRTDYSAANAHLTTREEQARLQELQKEFAKLTPEGQKLYRDTTSFFNELYIKEREAKLDGVVGVIAPDAPQAARDALKTELRTEAGIQRILASAKTSDDLAAALAIPGSLVKAIAQFHQMGFVRGDYFPLRRYGEYVLINGDRQSGNYSVQMFESMAAAEKVRQAMAEARDPKTGEFLYPDIQQITTKKKLMQGRGADLANPILDELTNRVTSKYGAEQAAAINDMLTSIMLQHMTRSEATRTRLRRQGVEGASTDAARVIADDAHAATWRLGYYTHGLERAKALRDLRVHVGELRKGKTPKELELEERIEKITAAGGDATASRQELIELNKQPRPSRPDARIAQQALNEVEARQPTSDDPSMRTAGRVVGKVTHMAYVHGLLSISTSLINTIEAHTTATAMIGGRHGFKTAAAGLGRAVAEMLPEGAKQLTDLHIKAWNKELQAKDWDIGEVMKDRLVKAGANKDQMNKLFEAGRAVLMLDAGGTLARDIRRMANPGLRVGETKLGRGWDIFMDLSTILGHVSEEASKMAILKTAFDAEMKKNNNNVDKSVAYAVNELEKAVPNYRGKARIATPQGILGQYGPAVFQFKNYGFHMYTSVLPVLARQALRGEHAAEARWALGGIAVASAALSGVNNIISDPLRLFGGAYDVIMREKRPYAKPALEAHARRFADKLMGPTLAEMFSRGLPHAAGYGGDLSTRLGFNNPFGFPDLKDYSWASVTGGVGAWAVGAPGSTAADFAGAVSAVGDGRYGDALKKAAPRSLRDFYKAYELASGGIKDPRGRTILPPERLPSRYGAAAMQAVGITPSPVSEFREQRREITRVDQRVADFRRQILDGHAQGKDVSNALNWFNSGIGQYSPITRSTLNQAAKRQAQQIADPATGGMRIPARRQDLYDAGSPYNFPGRAP